MSLARGLASGLVLPQARGLVRGSAGGGGAPWDGLTNIIGMWPMNESGAGPALDASGNGVDMTAFNSPTYNATGGPGGIACRSTASGVGGYFQASGFGSLFDTDVTLVMWMKIAGSSTRGTFGCYGGGYVDGARAFTPSLFSGVLSAGGTQSIPRRELDNNWRGVVFRWVLATKTATTFITGQGSASETYPANIQAASTLVAMATGYGIGDDMDVATWGLTRYAFTDAEAADFVTSARDWAYWQSFPGIP